LASFIPEDKISEIKNTADIVAIISETVVLKKTGANYSGLCPFHSEKTPSFTVSPQKQFFYCFGCGTGGTVFNFLMKRDGLKFPEAAKTLARRCGIEIPVKKMSREQKRRLTLKESMLNVNRHAMEFFQRTLFGSEGEIALAYLKKRGIKEKFIRKFSLGYVPAGWSNLSDYFKENGHPLSLAAKVGLVMPNRSRNGFYDRFRDRIMFPIFDAANRVIAFGGRVMDDSMPKYLNSPESQVYSKRSSLYGIFAARDECRAKKKVYITEGYFDAIALHQNGISNSVATLGTYLTPMHLRLVNGLVGKEGKAILVFDSDEAGINAAMRSIEIFEKNFVEAKILTLHSGHDPDSFIFKFGIEAFLTAAEEAFDIVPFLFDCAEKRHGLSVQGKIRIISDMKRPLSSIEDDVARAFYVRHFSERLKIDESVVMKAIRKESSKKAFERNDEKKVLKNNKTSLKGFLKTGEVPESFRIELKILAMMLQSPEMFHEVRRRNIIDSFDDEQLKTIGRLILEDRQDHSGIPSDIVTRIDDDEHMRIFASIAVETEPWTRKGGIGLLEQFDRNRRKNDLSQKIEAAEKAEENELLMKLLKKKQALAATTARAK